MLGEALDAAGVGHQVQFAGNLVSVFFTDDPSTPITNYDQVRATQTHRFAPFFHAMPDAGVYPPPSAFEAWFVRPPRRRRLRHHRRRAVGAAAAPQPPRAGSGTTDERGRSSRSSGTRTGDAHRRHMMRHGEVFNLSGILYGRLPGSPSRRPGAGRRRPSPMPSPTTRSPRLRLAAAAGRRPRRRSRRRTGWRSSPTTI